MIFDLELIKHVYTHYQEKVNHIRQVIGRPLTLTEKILYAHLAQGEELKDYQRGVDYVNFAPDRVAMQDATAQMALLQLMNSGRDRVAVPSTVHCDHLIQAYKNAYDDLIIAENNNQEVYQFLRDVSNKYGIGFWKPDAGIIHQVVLENYAFPGGMMIGTDSHTPNAGGLSMIAIGVGGADAVDVMAGMSWELKMPRLIGVKLTGKLSGWSAPKDVILKLAGILTVKGGTNSIIEYFGEGTQSLSATGKATICNMGAEVGATTSIFPYDKKSADYLAITGRQEIVDLAHMITDCFNPDPQILDDPAKYYDQIIEINLSELEPYVNGPFTPDLAYPISKLAEAVKEHHYPNNMEVGLIGSCTNSSYEDMSRAASVIDNANKLGLSVKAKLIINPGSEQVKFTAERDGILDKFEQAGAVIMANACGPCIGQWRRDEVADEHKNSIVTSFNRNFAKRNDGNPNTNAFVCSPEIVAALSIAGSLTFNPLTDTLTNAKGQPVKLPEPIGDELPKDGFDVDDAGYVEPIKDGSKVIVNIAAHSDRLQQLAPFAPWDGKDIVEQPLLIKVAGKCTTDHISMAGKWLKYRGHLDNISNNMLIGAVNAFNEKTNSVIDPESKHYLEVPALARKFKAQGLGSVVVAEENYGEGSSREHAAMEPRFLNVKAIVVKSFARIHETNLKKQGMLALTFINKEDYDKVQEDDKISILGLTEFTPGKNLTMVLHHRDGNIEAFPVAHTYNDAQISWFKAGSALNKLKSEFKKELKGFDMSNKVTITNGKLTVPNNPIIPFIEGDGVGAEIWQSAKAIFDSAVAKAYQGQRNVVWQEVLAGEKSFNHNGSWLPDETMNAFKEYLIGIKGPLTTPVGGGIRSLNVALRQELDLYVCLRPVRWFKGVESPIKAPDKVNMTIFRENTEDIYAGIEWQQGSAEAEKFYQFISEQMGVKKVRFPKTSAFGVKPVSTEGSERLIRAAIRYALDHKLPSVTLVHKGNIMKFTEGGFKQWGYELAEREFTSQVFTMQAFERLKKQQGLDAAKEALKAAKLSGKLIVKDVICDAFLQNTLLKPEDYSVIATLNLNGDYVSDQLAAMVGGIGIAPGANINYLSGHAIFEATHGTAPDIAGEDMANPSSLILSGVMMFDYLGWFEVGQLITDAMEKLFQQGQATVDLARFMPNGNILTTSQFTQAVISHL